MTIRTATGDDVEALLVLAEAGRAEYERYAPTFWRKAADGKEKQRGYFQALLGKSDVIALVCENLGRIEGFLIATVGEAPPVYDPGSRVVVIDDFTVSDASQWDTLGAALLGHARERARELGANLSVVVCAHRDAPKRNMLRAGGFSLASEWYVNPA